AHGVSPRAPREPDRDAVEDDRMIVHGRDVNGIRQAAPSFRQLTSRNPPPVSVTFNEACQRAAAGTSRQNRLRSGADPIGSSKVRYSSTSSPAATTVSAA